MIKTREIVQDFFQAVMHHNNPYFWHFILCEVLNFIVLVFVVTMTDLFLGGQFWGYGWRVYDHYYYAR